MVAPQDSRRTGSMSPLQAIHSPGRPGRAVYISFTFLQDFGPRRAAAGARGGFRCLAGLPMPGVPGPSGQLEHWLAPVRAADGRCPTLDECRCRVGLPASARGGSESASAQVRDVRPRASGHPGGQASKKDRESTTRPVSNATPTMTSGGRGRSGGHPMALHSSASCPQTCTEVATGRTIGKY
jgi:hypothetical protein